MSMSTGSGSFAASLPKVHLHCHLEGSLRAQTFLELIGRYGYPTRFRPGKEFAGEEHERAKTVDEAYRFDDFNEFLMLFAAVSRALKEPEDYARLAREFVEDALAQRVVYGELFISPSVWTFFHPDLDVRAALDGIDRELKHAQPAATFRLIVDVTRNFGADSAMRTAQQAVTFTDASVIGIGLGGDEARFPAELFKDVYAFARSQGLHTVVHAGEAAGAQSVRAAVEVLGAERIGHGVRALEDPAVVQLLAERRIPLEICPTSNFLTGAASREKPHPLLELDEAGAIVTIDADDPTLFGTSITNEYEYVERLAGREALARFVNQAADVSFLEPEAKRALRARLSAELLTAQ